MESGANNVEGNLKEKLVLDVSRKKFAGKENRF